MINKLVYKNRLHQHCIGIIKDRIAAIAQAMNAAQAAANSEEKSSAGDKYETSRAMSHLEKDMQGRQIAANQAELAALLLINCNKIQQMVSAGSIVEFATFNFFIAGGLGKIIFDDFTVYLISPNAPVAKTLWNKKVGDKIIFNNKEEIILAVF